MATVVATVVPAAPTAAAFRNSRRFIAVSSPVVRCFRPLAGGLARARKLASFAPGDHHLPVIPGLAEGEAPTRRAARSDETHDRRRCRMRTTAQRHLEAPVFM